MRRRPLGLGSRSFARRALAGQIVPVRWLTPLLRTSLRSIYKPSKGRHQQKNHLQKISTSQRRRRPAALLCTASVAHGSMRAFKWAASIALGNDPEGSPTSGITRGRAGSLPAGLQHHNRDRDATSNRTSSMQPSDDVDVRSCEAGGRTAGDW